MKKHQVIEVQQGGMTTMSNTTWKTIPPAQACDWIEFWINAPWPMNEKETAEYAAQLGWTAEEDDGEIYLTDAVSGLSMDDVATAAMPSGETASIGFRLTDVIRDITDESDEFLNDQFTLVYREAQARWGNTKQAGTDSATWDWEDKARVTLTRLQRSVSVNIDTPSYAKVLRQLGE